MVTGKDIKKPLCPPLLRLKANTRNQWSRWNSLPVDVAAIDSLTVFRRHLKVFCSAIRIRALFYNCTLPHHRGLEAFYIALGHVNLTGN